MVSLLEAAPLDNVVCSRASARRLGVPGMRLGYVYSSNAAFLRYLSDRVPIWNLNSVAEYMLELILKHRGSLSSSYVATAKDRARLIGALNDVPRIKRVFPSGGNFVMFELDRTAPRPKRWCAGCWRWSRSSSRTSLRSSKGARGFASPYACRRRTPGW